MIRFQLCCASGHEFEGWFQNSGSFDEQREAALVACPECGSADVTKALMAPAITRNATVAPTPETLMAALRQVRRTVETQCDDVGDRFAEEATRRHRLAAQGEAVPERGVYGTMSEDQRTRLDDEGIEYAAIPWIRADA
jgi:hypothetical protein